MGAILRGCNPTVTLCFIHWTTYTYIKLIKPGLKSLKNNVFVVNMVQKYVYIIWHAPYEPWLNLHV